MSQHLPIEVIQLIAKLNIEHMDQGRRAGVLKFMCAKNNLTAEHIVREVSLYGSKQAIRKVQLLQAALIRQAAGG